MTAYYNEIDPYAAQWLRDLIVGEHIAPGDVDERSIEDARADGLTGYTQVHFFAGIGGWSLALRLAGWPDDRPVWTGSCPCQPFSAAGKGAGFADERHLWPAFFRLIRECRPDRVFGEQVASSLAWLDLVSGDLEGEGYAVGSAIVGAHSVGAPHIRQRLYWVADADGRHSGAERQQRGGEQRQQSADGRAGNGLAHDDTSGRSLERRGGLLDGERPAFGHDADGRGADGGRLGNGERARLEGLAGHDDGTPGREDAHGSAWAASVLVECADGRWRPVPTEPGLFPLAHGVPGRVGRLRAYGNAIVPQVAAAFIRALP